MNEEIKDKIKALENEKAEIQANLAKVPQWEKRLYAIVGGWGYLGELQEAKLQLRDSEFPIYDQCRYITRRIIEVNDIWIVLRQDRQKETTKFRIRNGWREKSRSDNFTIDVERALKIWKEHNQKPTP